MSDLSDPVREAKRQRLAEAVGDEYVQLLRELYGKTPKHVPTQFCGCGMCWKTGGKCEKEGSDTAIRLWVSNNIHPEEELKDRIRGYK